MPSPDRYLSPAQFGSLARELKLVDQPFQDNLLEFLERQEILKPALRMRYPDALVLEDRGVAVDPPSSIADGAAADAFNEAMSGWRRYDADPELDHPLDRDGPQPWERFVSRPGDRPFQAWSDMRTNIRPEGESPLYVKDGTDTFYQPWQILAFADAQRLGIHLLFDTRRPELRPFVFEDIRNLPEGVSRQYVRLDAPRQLTALEAWACHLDSVSRFLSTEHRLIIRSADAAHSPAQAEYEAGMIRAARSALNRTEGGRARWIEFLRDLAERWDELRRSDRLELSNEYRRQIGATAKVVTLAGGTTFADLVVEVGTVGSGFGNTLDLVFPDKRVEARDSAERSLIAAVVNVAPNVGPDLTLTAADATDLLDWSERKGDWRLHLHIETILARQFRSDAVDHVALAKEVESIAGTLEQSVIELLKDAGVVPGKTLVPKLIQMWSGVDVVKAVLVDRTALTSTKASAPRTHRVAEIRRLRLAGEEQIAGVMLLAALYRNDGAHNGMKTWPHEELQAVTRVLLTALMFCRKAMTAGRHPVPTPLPRKPHWFTRVRRRLGRWISGAQS